MGMDDGLSDLTDPTDLIGLSNLAKEYNQADRLFGIVRTAALPFSSLT
jgi:hypothetical protein